jgi:hypothetical protein
VDLTPFRIDNASWRIVRTTADRSATWVFTPTPAVNDIPLPDLAHWYKQDDDRPA